MGVFTVLSGHVTTDQHSENTLLKNIYISCFKVIVLGDYRNVNEHLGKFTNVSKFMKRFYTQ